MQTGEPRPPQPPCFFQAVQGHIKYHPASQNRTHMDPESLSEPMTKRLCLQMGGSAPNQPLSDYAVQPCFQEHHTISKTGFTRTTVIELSNPIMLAVHLRTAGLRPPQPPHFLKLYKATASIILPAKTEPIWPLSERVIKTSCVQMGAGCAPPPNSPAFLFTPCRFAFKNIVPSTRTVSKTHHAGRWGGYIPPNSRTF